MKIKSIIKKALPPIAVVIFLMYITVYITSFTGYYSSIEGRNSSLTKEAIERFEKDVLSGEKIVASNYLEEKKEYDNLLSRSSIKIGKIIEKIFNKIMKTILNEIESAIK